MQGYINDYPTTSLLGDVSAPTCGWPSFLNPYALATHVDDEVALAASSSRPSSSPFDCTRRRAPCKWRAGAQPAWSPDISPARAEDIRSQHGTQNFKDSKIEVPW